MICSRAFPVFCVCDCNVFLLRCSRAAKEEQTRQQRASNAPILKHKNLHNHAHIAQGYVVVSSNTFGPFNSLSAGLEDNRKGENGSGVGLEGNRRRSADCVWPSPVLCQDLGYNGHRYSGANMTSHEDLRAPWNLFCTYLCLR